LPLHEGVEEPDEILTVSAQDNEVTQRLFVKNLRSMRKCIAVAMRHNEKLSVGFEGTEIRNGSPESSKSVYVC
jgi:hypothetical protein